MVSNEYCERGSQWCVPGMVDIVPQSGYKKPAPTLARRSRTGTVKPVGTPLRSPSHENDKCVLAMQIGRPEKPYDFVVG